MNFKDSYKKANEKIQGDISILDKIYEPEKKIITPYFYRMTTIAAAFILVGAVIVMSPFKENVKKEELVKEHTVVEETQGTFKFMARDTIKEDRELNENKPIVEITQETNEAEVHEVINEEVMVLSLDEEDEAIAVYDAQAFSEEAEADIVSGGGGSSKMAMFSVASMDSEDNLTDTKEVLILLGISDQKLMLEDMELDIPEKIKVTFNDEGLVEDFAINFSITGADSKIEGVLINSVNPVSFEIKKDGEIVSAQKTFGNTDIFIKAYNMDEEKVTEFLERFN